jgi:hypothetical protein
MPTKIAHAPPVPEPAPLEPTPLEPTRPDPDGEPSNDAMLADEEDEESGEYYVFPDDEPLTP